MQLWAACPWWPGLSEEASRCCPWLVLGLVFPPCPPPAIPVVSAVSQPVSHWGCSMLAAPRQPMRPEVPAGAPVAKGRPAAPVGCGGQTLPVAALGALGGFKYLPNTHLSFLQEGSVTLRGGRAEDLGVFTGKEPVRIHTPSTVRKMVNCGVSQEVKLQGLYTTKYRVISPVTPHYGACTA